MDCHFSSRLTATLNVCPIYLDSGDSDDSDDSDDSWDSDDSDDSDDSVKRCKTLFFNSETFSNVSGLKK